MTPDRPERKNPRLRGWDYGAGGTYFVTFCTSAHRPVLSSIRRGDPCGRPPLVLTPLGECVAEAIALTGVRVEHQVIMPNHVHLLLTLERAATRAAPTGAGTQADARVAPTDSGTRADARIAPTGRGTQADARVSPTDRGTQAAARVAPTGRGMQAAAELGRLIGAVKSRSVHLAAGRGLKAGRLWQRGYYDHIVRSENDFLRIWTYIDNNPLRWELDRYYTER